MGITDTLSRLPHPPASWLFQPVRVIPWEVRNRPLEKALNHAFKEPLCEDEFDALDGRWLQVSITDLELDFYLTISDQKMQLTSPRPCDVVFRGDSVSFLALATRKEDPDTLFFNRKLTIEGDTELGLAIKNMLDAVELEQFPKAVQWALRKSGELQQFLKHTGSLRSL
ncbi:ubiquinone anaerobic biosynthesis accessory factor UbiT [Sansalvadorimonas verongulae]|uniref:ubiquinone anaerobic biosynthesis accessory factor UbiT n=1 Tax=Sansalvadorimonas verongulae TaxID=2172824 RepID=UPI0012BB9728|nr:SCP2 sterol-binding domain-containing protein [Sansalvadorimonas verongulae]MTI12803.1 SCP2 domain-containing protein [Sansalvadorimonas verongulae]